MECVFRDQLCSTSGITTCTYYFRVKIGLLVYV